MSTIAQRLPADRRFEFGSDACAPDTFAVVRMSGVEAISKPYRFELVLVSDDAQIELAKVLGAAATLRILAPDDVTRATPYAGMLVEFDQLHQAGGFTFYRAVLVPRLWQLSLYRSSEVYLHEQTIPEIVEGILKSARLRPGRDYVLQLKGNYRPRSYVCQYQETPLAFVSRWLEREGIYYYFEQVDGCDRLVLLDDRVTQPAPAVAVNYRPADELDTGLAPDSVQGFICRSRMLPRTLVLQDFNHRRASLPLVVQAEVSASGLGEEMLYGENFRTEEEGQRYADIRAQALRCGERVFSGEATAVGLRSGYFMDLAHHYREDFNGRYLVTEITHEGSQAGALLAGLKTPFNERDGQTTFYRNSFVALPAATQFRPARTTPKPHVFGTMNATIDAEGSGEYAELDAYGQYKVQIPFDRTEKGAAKGSAPVRMASPYAGSDHGMHFPLHKGAEVLLSFTDGDPDQPVILGAVPNSVNPNVVDQRNPHDNLISTKGGNQMLMSDTKGKEVIWLHSPFHKSSIGVGSVHPEGGGSIYEATTGGKDSVSFGNSNSMSFGPANSLSLGTKASLGAAFSNDVSLGSKIGIDVSSSLSWKANLGRLPSVGSFGGADGLMSVSIDDSKSVKLSRSFGGASTGTATIAAGALSAEASNLDLETSLMALRAMIAGYSTLNFAQSAVFGMAVNGSADGALLGGTQKEQKADQERKDAAWTEKEATDKATEKANLKTPADVEAKGPEAVKAWKAEEEKKIDEKYKRRAAEQAAPSNPERQTLQGWPGIIGKFGLDAVSNVAAMALIQWYGRTIAAKIAELKLVSEMTLGESGITQAVNGEDAPDLSGAALAAWMLANPLVPAPMSVRSEFTMNPHAGVTLKAAAKGDDWDDVDALTGGAIRLASKLIELKAGDTLSATAPAGSVGTAATPAVPSVGMHYSGASDTVGLTASKATVTANGSTLGLSAETIEIGRKLVAPEVTKVAAIAARRAAEVALQAAQAARKETRRVWRAAVVALKRARVADPLLESAVVSTKSADDTAVALVIQMQGALDQAVARETSAVASTPGPLMHGLTITDSEASLAFGAAGWKATHTGLHVNFGDSQADFQPVGVSLDGTMIKLG